MRSGYRRWAGIWKWKCAPGAVRRSNTSANDCVSSADSFSAGPFCYKLRCAYHAGKYYVFDGFDINLDKIKDDAQVEVVYDIKDASEINYFDDLYKWFREIEIEKIENITINYFEEQEFMPIVKKGCELGEGDGGTINELITELKEERFIDKINGDKFGSINKYYYLNFTINNYEYVMYIPISSQVLADGRTISSSLTNYLGSLIGNE